MDLDKISDELSYSPNISLPVGSSLMHYERVNDLPIPPLPDLVPITFSVTDTLYLNINDVFGARESIQTLGFQYDNTNRYPAKVKMQLYYIDESGNNNYLTPVDGIRLEEAEINDDGFVTKEYKNLLAPEPLSEEQIDGLFETDKVVIELTIINLVLTPNVRENFNSYFALSAVGVQAQLLIED
jgi:hypothetical protein